MRSTLSRIFNGVRHVLSSVADTVGDFFSDAWPLLILFAVLGVAGSLTGLTTFTFLDDVSPATISAAVHDEFAKSDLVQVVAKVDGVQTSVDAITSSVDSIKQEVSDLKSTLATDRGGGRRVRIQSTQSANPAACLKLPDGVDIDLEVLTAASRGTNVVATGETYAAALVRHGFRPDEIATLDEATCRKVYDGWRTLHPPMQFRSVSETRRSGWSCSNGRCYRK